MASLNEFTGILGRAEATHLLRRATFGPRIQDIEQFTGLTAAEALDLLLDDSAEDPAPPVDPATGLTWVDPAGDYGTPTPRAGSGNSEQDDLFTYFQCWHMDVMRQAPLTLKERISWFFHTHIPARWTEILSSEAIYYQNCLYRYYAYGSFKELFKKICIDNAMLVYLDGYTNRKNSPNENFAREMFELYSIGKGQQIAEGDYTNYTEDDIREATKVLTGWMFDETFTHLDADTGIPIGKLRTHMEGDPAVEVATEHDGSQKTFTSKFAGRTVEPLEEEGGFPTVEATNAELADMIEMIFEQQETGRFIARKLYRFFVYHFISEEVENEVIGPLAQILITNDYQVVEALKVLLKSEHFFDRDDNPPDTSDDNIGALIKSPVDLFAGLFRLFEIQLPDRNSDPAGFYNDMGYIVSKLVDQGLNFYEPFEVAGYPAYHQIPGYNRNWITTYALAHRYQAAAILMKILDPGTDRTVYFDIVDWVENSGHISDPSDSVEIVDVLLEILFPVQITQERYDYFLYTKLIGFPEEDPTYARALWKNEWELYEGGGGDSGVRSRLEGLFTALIETPEFQIY